ncbi:MAG: UDP-N-acetylmuramoyl-tripeptide--D-alanyl-D-alanine ligase [Bacillota bacterium]
MKHITIENIVAVTKGKLIATGSTASALQGKVATSVVIDSRKVEQNSLFVPIKGENVDGNDYILDAFEKGAIAAFTDTKLFTPPEGKYLIYVDNVKTALLALGRYYKNMFDIPFVAITGSVGKTTTKDMIASVVKQKYNTLATEGNYNNDLGVPLTLFRLKDYHEVAIIEMGMNHSGEIRKLVEIVEPSISVISNVGVAHIEFLGSRENILFAKCEIFAYMKATDLAICNLDDDMLIKLEGKTKFPIEWFSTKQETDVYATDIVISSMTKTKCTVHTKEGDIDLVIPMAGEHMVSNALAAVSVGLALDVPLEDIKIGIESFELSKNRLDLIDLPKNITLLNDSYNANPVSMKASIDILSEAKNRTVAVLGYMGELGSFAPKMHEEVGEYLVKKGVDCCYYVGACGEDISSGAKKNDMENFYAFDSKEALWEALSKDIKENDTILVKGSRSMALETVVEKIVKQCKE